MAQETIAAFGEQWQRYDHTGPSLEEGFFQDVLGPLVTLSDLNGLTAADVGAGNGRFTAVLAKHAKQVLSVQPAPPAMQKNRSRNSASPNVVFQEKKAQDLTKDDYTADMVFCIGVLHHIPDMDSAISGMLNILKPSGQLVLWLYGKEGNGLYILFMRAMKIFTPWIPDAWLTAWSRFLVHPVKAYARFSKKYPRLPMADYFNKHIAHLSDHEIELIIFDQLNPVTAYYLSRPEIEKLLAGQGLTDLKFYHRHNYSWTVLARKAGQ